ncbi:MAG: group 1 truncated hemoglobin [Casimicrobiaceae bacterium]
MVDPRVGPNSAGVNMERLKKRAEPFLAMALGGPNNYHGPGLRQSHAHLVARGTDDSAFVAFVAHFADVLKELGVPEAKLAEVVPIFLGARSDVLNR